ncbi:MAG TPA: hypothetical protein VFV38_26400 [Ktedonobacteraceae bacterium]|nr:hypothetical protein [Ktedonobacteraceae bacterium]
MAGKRMIITGQLMGKRIKPPVATIDHEDIVKILHDHEHGPAENSIISVKVSPTNEKKAHYLSWIGYFDLDLVSAQEPDAWQLIEPAEPYQEEIEWSPYP